MFCPNCGNPAKDGAAFCGICGFKLKAPATPAPVVEAPAPAPAPVVEPVVEAPVVEVPAEVVAETPVVEEPAPAQEEPAPVVAEEAAPVAPAQPVAVAEPVAPAQPVVAAQPVAPVQPVQPVAPVQPGVYQPAAAPMAPAPKKGFDFNQITGQATNIFKNTILPFVMKWKIPLIAGAAVLVLVVGFLGIGAAQSNPKNIVENYFEGLIDGDYGQVYDTLAVTESDFVNKEKFIAFQEQNTDKYSDITKYEIQSYKEKLKEEYEKYAEIYGDDYEDRFEAAMEELENQMVEAYVITYVTNTSSSEKTMTVTLAEQSEKSWLFFTKYRVSTEGLIGSHTIKTRKDAVVTVDGSAVTNIAKTDGDTVEFKIDAIFEGEHELKITHPACDEYTDTISVGSGTTTYATNLTISKATKEAIFKTSQESIKKLANGAKDGKSFDSLGIACTKDEKKLAELKDNYSDLTEYFRKSDGTGLKSITYTSFSDSSYQDTIGTGSSYSCYVSTNYDYTSARKSYFNDSITQNTSSYSGRFTMKYDFVDGEWVLAGFTYFNYYY